MCKYLTALLLVQNTASSLHPKCSFLWMQICVLLSSWELCAAAGLCCWKARTFSEHNAQVGTWAEWEDSWKTATYHRTLALQVHSSCLAVWNNIVAMEKIKDIFTQNDIGIWRSTVWSPFRRFLVVYTLVGGLADLLSFCWRDDIQKVKESLWSLFCYSFKALFFSFAV